MVTEDVLSADATSHTLGIDPDYPYIDDTQTVVGYYWNSGLISDYTLVNLSSTMYDSAIAGNLVRLNTSECINRYATTFPTSQGSVILVTNNATQTPFVTVYEAMEPINDKSIGCPARSFDWICAQLSQPADRGCHSITPCAKRLSELDRMTGGLLATKSNIV